MSGLASLLGLIALPSAVKAGAENPGLYAAVPEADRESLRAAVERMIALRRASRWDEIYNFLDNPRHLTKEEFMRQSKTQTGLIEFVPSSVTYYPPTDVWAIHGCAVFVPAPRGRRAGVFSSFDARRAADGWRFSQIAIVLLKDEPGGTRACTVAKPVGIPVPKL